MDRASEEDHEPPVLNIAGDLVALGPLRRDLLPLYQRWINDFGTLRMLGGFLPTTLEGETKWYDEWATSEKVAPFTIYALPGLQPIGTTSLFGLDHRNRTAEFGIFIGDPEYQGKGYGTETTRLMLDYAFAVVGLHNILLKVLEPNSSGKRAYEKAGFKECGRRRQCYLMNGKLWDEILMECLSTEFESPAPGRVFAPERRQ